MCTSLTIVGIQIWWNIENRTFYKHFPQKWKKLLYILASTVFIDTAVITELSAACSLGPHPLSATTHEVHKCNSGWLMTPADQWGKATQSGPLCPGMTAGDLCMPINNWSLAIWVHLDHPQCKLPNTGSINVTSFPLSAHKCKHHNTHTMVQFQGSWANDKDNQTAVCLGSEPYTRVSPVALVNKAKAVWLL